MAFDRNLTLRGVRAAGTWLAAPSRRVPAAVCGALAGLAALVVARRLAGPGRAPRPIDAEAAASNGHGSAAHLVASEP